MPFTDNNGVLLYAAVNEHGIDRIVRLAMQQQPSRFSYATANLIANHSLLCQAMQDDLAGIHPEVAKRGDPWFTEERPLPVVGTNGLYALDYAFQVSVVAIDFSPASAIALPPPLAPQQPQRMAIQFELRGGVGLPSAQAIAAMADAPAAPNASGHPRGQTIIQADTLTCFRVDLYAVVGAGLEGPAVNVAFDGMKLTGVLAPELEGILEGYVNLVMHLVVLPRLKSLIPTHFSIRLPKLRDELDLTLAYDLSLSAVPTSVANNPAFQNDQLEAFIAVAEVPKQ